MILLLFFFCFAFLAVVCGIIISTQDTDFLNAHRILPPVKTNQENIDQQNALLRDHDYVLPTIIEPNEQLDFDVTLDSDQPLLIPLTLYQTWKTSVVGPLLYTNYRHNANISLRFERRFIDDTSARDFIVQHFTKREVEAYDVLIPGAYKADILRMCLLFKNGGFYKDINKTLHVNLEPLAQYSLIVFRDSNPAYIFQGLLACAPQNKHMGFVLDHIVSDCLDHNAGHDYLFPTGPGAFGHYLNLSLGRSPTDHWKPGVMQDQDGNDIYVGQVIYATLCDATGNRIQKGRYEGSEQVEVKADHYSRIWPHCFHETKTKNINLINQIIPSVSITETKLKMIDLTNPKDSSHFNSMNQIPLSPDPIVASIPPSSPSQEVLV